MFTAWKIQVVQNDPWNSTIDYYPFNHLFSFFSSTKAMALFNMIQNNLHC